MLSRGEHDSAVVDDFLHESENLLRRVMARRFQLTAISGGDDLPTLKDGSHRDAFFEGDA